MFVITDYGFTNKVTKLTDADGELIAFDIVECWVHDTIRYDTIRYDTIRYDTIRYDTIRYDMIRYDNSLLYFDVLGRLAR